MTGADAIATLACALCIGAAAAVLKSGVTGAYLLAVPTAILLTMWLS